MFILSGQVRTDNISYLQDKNLRQLGDQEVKIENIVKTITKKVETIKTFNLSKINQLIDEMVYICQNGRKGPVWLDVPIDIQGKQIENDAFVSKLLKTKKLTK